MKVAFEDVMFIKTDTKSQFILAMKRLHQRGFIWSSGRSLLHKSELAFFYNYDVTIRVFIVLKKVQIVTKNFTETYYPNQINWK